MKSLVSVLFVIVIAFIFLSSETYHPVTGQVLDEENVPLIGAQIIVKGTDITTISDMDGKFQINMPDSEDVIIVSYIGYESKEVKVGTDFLLIKLNTDSRLIDEVVLTGYENTLELSSKKRRSASKSARLADIAMTMSMAESSISPFAPEHSDYSGLVGSATPASGQMTAGEWNDLNNWEDWTKLINEEHYKSMANHWNIYATERYSVFITNKDEYPVINAMVELLDEDDNTIWHTMTDNTGKAELWNSLNAQQGEVNKIRINKGNKEFIINNPVQVHQGSNHLSINIDCATENQVDIAFIVDATGSMGDEIQFLKSELSDITGKLEGTSDGITYRTASVFYRDKSEEYLTKVSGFSHDIDETTSFINANDAGGGGDYEEAVEEGINEALGLDWNPNAVSRLAFLILDAPPHHTPETLDLLKSQITEAAKRGIKLIPITASGINRETEFLMKYFSIITNATYVFITDDSGIGNQHLDPVVDDFEVEKLNDLIYRLIKNYSAVESCDKNKRIEAGVKVYPNPASEYINIELEDIVDKIILRSASGKIVINVSDPEVGTNTIRLDDLVGGMYTLSILYNNEINISKPIIIINII